MPPALQLSLDATPRVRVLKALRAHDERPAGCPDLAHRVALRDALRSACVPATASNAVYVARQWIGGLS